ncbi:MAG: TVP38/TMEM64 family protein [Deltaproteobacteria bacterium]|nr:TVP38/TMEM64 family protein [Deltaproteobacteria bacterium]
MSEAQDEASQPDRAKLLKIAAVAVGLIVFIVLTRRLGGYIPELAGWVENQGALGPLIFIAAYVVGVVAFLPGALLTLTGGALFSLPMGTVYVFTAAVIGSALAFLSARYLARGMIEEKLRHHPRFAALDSAVADQGLKIVFLLRLSPAFPFNFMNYALGVTRVSFRDYMIASIGMLPGTLLYVYYGKVAGDAAALAAGAAVDKDAAYYVVLALGLVATIAVTAIVTRLARKALAENTPQTVDAMVSPTTP